MITIIAEKIDVGIKIAAALDKITLSSGKVITFDELDDKSKTIKSELGKKGYTSIQYKGEECAVTWGSGHLCELKQAYDYNPTYKNWRNIPLPFFPDNYEIKVKEGNDDSHTKRIKNQLSIIKDLLKKSRIVINATDFDREGEVIFAYIYEYCKGKAPIKRACFLSQEKDGIIEGFDKMKEGSDMKNLLLAGKTRNIADLAVGSNCTVACTLKSRNSGVLSIGRVQTPTLAILVNKELAIRNHIPVPYWTIESVFETSSGEVYKGKHITDRFNVRNDAETVYNKTQGEIGIITKIESKDIKKEAPDLFSQSSLQMEANSRFGFSMKKTLDIAQKLYDGGFTTYPRTAACSLPPDMEPKINKVLDNLIGIPDYSILIQGKSRSYNRNKYFNLSGGTSHFAIVPTGKIPTKSLSPDEEKIYDLICKSVISMLYDNAIVKQTKLITTVNGEDFVSTGSMVHIKGWMEVMGSPKKDALPDNLHQGENVETTITINDKKTEPPKRYTDKTLLSAMISAGKDLSDSELRKIMSDPHTGGIGTEATRAAIVDTLEKRGFISRDKKTVFATDKGIEIIENLPLPELKSAEMTALWEQRLNKIADGTESADKFLKDLKVQIEKWIIDIDNSKSSLVSAPISTTISVGKCPVCGMDVVKTKWGYGCSGYKNGCKFTIGDICKKKLTENQVSALLDKKITPEINGFVSKSNKKFSAKLKLNGSKIEFEFKN